MKQKLMIAVAALLFSLNLHAALIEYTFNGQETDLGAGSQNRYALKGIMIYDTVTSNVTYVTWLQNKTYSVYTVDNYQSLTVVGPGTRQNLLLTLNNSFTDDSGYNSTSESLIGSPINLHIGRNDNVSFPRDFTSSNTTIYPDGGGNQWISTWTETLEYDDSRTVNDNNAGLDVSAVVNAIVVGLQEKGYTNSNPT